MATKNWVIGLAVALIADALIILYRIRSAKAAAELRPKLIEVGFFDASLSGHGLDWIYYHKPIIGMALTSLVVVPAGMAFVVVKLED